jgi:glycosyltransferase involved in cell wall biosynthesis
VGIRPVVTSKSMPTVSVIIPNYSHAPFLRQRIETVLGQTYQDFEVILLDDCSTDESRAIISEYANDPRIRIEFNDKNSGSTFKQWNKGVQLARGEYVWIAESDDYADERLLDELVSRLDSNPNTVFAYCRSGCVSEDGKVEGFLDSFLRDLHSQKWTADFWVDGHEECEKYLVHRNTVPSASAVLFRKKIYQQVGGADEKLVFCGDWKTWVSMALAGGGIAYTGEVLNYHRFHAMSVTSKSQRLGVEADEYLQVILWILQRVTPSQSTREKLGHDLFELWSPRVLTKRTPLSRRWRILKNARAIDRSALGKLVGPALTALRFKLSCHFRRNPQQ